MPEVRPSAPILAFLLAFPLAACGGGAEAPPAKPAEAAAPITNRVEIPPAVRDSLGMTFARAELRPVERTVRVAGAFEPEPDARREYRAPLAGRVEPAVAELVEVAPGELLFTLDAPAWRELQGRIAEAEAAVARAGVQVDSAGPMHAAHEDHARHLEQSLARWESRIAQLEAVRAAGGGAADALAEAQVAASTVRSHLAELREKDVSLEADRRTAEEALRAARASRSILLDSAAAILGVDREAVEAETDGVPLWRSVRRIAIRAADRGQLAHLAVAPGRWVGEGELLGTVLRPERVRFRVRLLAGDLGRMREGLEVRLVPGEGSPQAYGGAGEGILRLAPSVEPGRRVVEGVIVPRVPVAWAKPGLAGFAEVLLDGMAEEELAIPRRAVVRDEGTPIFFRRDPANPDKAIRVAADLGPDDGRWVAVRSGLRAGDEVVIDGVYALLLATGGRMPKGGHFHADGTFHADDH